MKNKRIDRVILHLVPAVLTGFVVLCLLYVKHYAPFGDNTLACMDADIQYIDFYAYFKDVLAGKNSIAYTFGKTLGGTNIAVFSYYLSSPFTLLVAFFRKSALESFFDIAALLKLMTCALTFSVFITGRFRDEITDRWKRSIVIILSVSYALCQYSIAQSSNFSWLDGVYLLPLILLFVYQIANGMPSGWKLAIIIGISIIFNWYTAGINCLFSIGWLLLEMALSGGGEGWLKRFFEKLLRYGISMVIGVMISAVLFLPTILALRNGNRGDLDLYMLKNFSFIGNPSNFIQYYVYGGTSGPDHAALFAGAIAAVGLVSFFLSRKTLKKERLLLGAATILGLLMLYWIPLVMVFSLLKIASSYWIRYSYLFIFLLLFIAACYFMSIEKEKNHLLCMESAVLFSAVVFVYDHCAGVEHWEPVIEICVAVLVIGALLSLSVYVQYRIKNGRKSLAKILSVGLVLACTLDLVINASMLMDTYHGMNAGTVAEYIENEQLFIDSIKENDPRTYRISQTATRNNPNTVGGGSTAVYNEALAYNYWSISGYTSSPDDDQRTFLDKLGYRKNGENFNITNTSILGADSLLGVRYVLSPFPINGLVRDDSMGTANGKFVYRNPFALPIAFVVDGKVDDEKLNEENPFVYQSSVYSQLVGRQVDVYKPLDYEVVSKGDVGTGTAMKARISIPDGNYAVYGNIPTNSDMNATLTVNDRYSTIYSCWGAPSVFNIPFTGNSAEVELSSSTAYDMDYDAMQFYALDLDEMQSVSEELARRTPQNFSMKNGHVSAVVNSSADGNYLFLSIPEDKGWTITNNGREVTPDSIDGCLYMIRLHGGKNRIEMRYHVPGLLIGAGETLVGLFGVLLLWYFERRRSGQAAGFMKNNKIIDIVTLKFIMVGVINTIVGTSVMFLSYNLLGLSYWVSSAANYIVGSVVSYFLNKYFTFQSKGRSLKEVVAFVINISVCYLIAYGVAKPLAYKVLEGYGQSLRDNVAMLIGMCLFVVLNYFGQRFVVFKKEG